MDFKSALRKGAELGVVFTALTALILVGCGGGGASGGGTTTGVATSAKITPYKGQFTQGVVTVTDANGNPVALLSGGTVGANGIISVTYDPNVVYPLLVSVTGTYYNEVTGQLEVTTVPLHSLITNAAAAANVPVTIVTETAVALLLNQMGSISATNPIQVASAVADLGTAGTMFGIPASTTPTFNSGTNTTTDANTILLSAFAVVANSQAGATLADKVIALANSLASLNPASAPSDVMSQGALAAAISTMTGASGVAASGVAAPSAPTIGTTVAGPQGFNASVAAANSIVGAWNSGDTLNASVVTFFANGEYMQAKAATTNSGAYRGIEHGTYTWDSTTGAFTTACPPDVDTNGTDGFSHPDGVHPCTGLTATTGTVLVNGNTGTFTFNGGTSGLASRAIGNPIVGTWYAAGNTNSVFTFFANGYYMHSHSVTGPEGTPGLEYGAYTWNPTTGAFVFKCPTVVTNGGPGFSGPCTAGSTVMSTTVTVNGNAMTFINNGVNPQVTNIYNRAYSTTPGNIPGVGGTSFVTAYISQGGLTWSPPNSTIYSYAGANAFCSAATFNGLSGWRLPTLTELTGLATPPAVSPSVPALSNTIAPGGLYASGALNGKGWTAIYVWSSTPTASSATNFPGYWGVFLADNTNPTYPFVKGTVADSAPADNGNVTCVRAGGVTDVTSLLADELNSFTGGWWFTPAGVVPTPGQSIGAAVAGALGAADMYQNTVAVNSANHYTQTYAEQRMVSTTWSANTNSTVYNLPPTSGNWITSPTTVAIVDNLDGTFTWTPTGLTPEAVSVTRTDLTGTAIVCTDVTGAVITCPVPGNYPTGSSIYAFSNVPAANEFGLYGTFGSVPSAIAVLPVTDATGTALTALPALSSTTTLCDPNFLFVFQAISPYVSGDNANVFSTLSCAQADITTALASPVLGTVSVSVRATGNATVPSVIRVQATAPATAYLNNTILGLRAGAVYPGYMLPAGVPYPSGDSNKTAVNAELVANGLTPIP